VGVVMNKLGPKYEAVVKELQNTGTLSDASLRTLRKSLPEARYVAFARIENNEVVTDRSESSNTDKNGNTIEGSEKVISSAHRNVTASLSVYDLELAEVAWSGTVSKSLGSSRQYAKEKEFTLVSVINAIKGTGAVSADQKYPFPPAPETHQVLAKVFEGFGENMPEQD